MLLIKIILFFLIYSSYHVFANHLRVMTFNIWQSGANVENGMQKIAKHIQILNPDIVALQEVSNSSIVPQLELLLGDKWMGIFPEKEYPDVAILTRHSFDFYSIVATNWTMGVKIFLKNGQPINVWSAHLQYKSYGPYAAYNKLVSSYTQIMAGEKPSVGNGRWHNMMEVKENHVMREWLTKSKSTPILFLGDFNCPSHLDWTNERVHEHGGWIVEWPATKILADLGFTDSFRHIYPDSITHPGNTWSTVNKFNAEWDYTIAEPQDRIDFIFYIGPIHPIRSFTYRGNETLNRIPYHWKNDYPSDHFALITDFTLLKSY